MPRDFLDKVSRIALALERAGKDDEGTVESLHQDFIDIVALVPAHLRETTFTTVKPPAEDPPAEAPLPPLGYYEDLY